MLNAFTVDVEDYFQVSGFEKDIQRDAWSSFESRVVANTNCLLNLLETNNVHGTFFILGWVANRYPGLVRDIHDRGHEIGSHSYWHRLVYSQTKDQFREDLKRSKQTIEDIISSPVTAYRAPSFSITKQSRWALNILVEEGFQVDSSIVPVRHDRYGMPGAKRGPHRIETAAGELVEFPPTVTRIAGLNIPCGGGGYFRLFPYALTEHWLGQACERRNSPMMFYVHPWEVDPDQPRLGVGGWASRLRHHVNLKTTESKLQKLLQRFSFTSLSRSLQSVRQSEGGLAI